jgi:branched-chain amino acid transport system permease protein
MSNQIVETLKDIPNIIINNKLQSIILLLPFILPFVVQSKYIIHILTFTWIMSIGALGWDVLYGYGGLINFGHTVFFGTSAYLTTWLYLWFNLSPWIGLFISAFTVASIGVAIGWVTSRSKGVYFALATSAIPPILSVIFTINYIITGGSLGVSIPWKGNLPLAMQFRTDLPYYYISLIFLIILCSVVFFLTRSKLGYYLRAMGEDEDAAKSLGIDVFRVRLVAMFISGFIGGISGAIFVNFFHFIDPYEAFGWATQVNFLLYTVLGGSGTIIGPVLGTLIVVPFSEIVKLFLEEHFRGIHLVVYGSVLMIIILLMPKGVYPKIRSYLRREER